jgi:hypothetical protein
LEAFVGISTCWMFGTARKPSHALPMTPLNATKDMKIASTMTSAMDHLDSPKANSFTKGLVRNSAGRKRYAPSASIFSAGKTTLNRITSTATSVISGRPIWISV